MQAINAKSREACRFLQPVPKGDKRAVLYMRPPCLSSSLPADDGEAPRGGRTVYGVGVLGGVGVPGATGVRGVLVGGRVAVGVTRLTGIFRI
jgi:hypothetical protein